MPLPQFRLRWYSVLKNPTKTTEDIKNIIILSGKQLLSSESSEESDSDGQIVDEFFDFSADKDHEESFTEQKIQVVSVYLDIWRITEQIYEF